jgi:D-ribose pyranose/furanose isomerase RbsD
LQSYAFSFSVRPHQLAAKKDAKLAAKDAKKRPIDNSVDLITTEQTVEAVTVSDEVKELKEQMAAIQKLIDQKSRTKHTDVPVKTPVDT